ncbi:MAG TPA: hypothetical protein VF773_11730 [Verrucomicrobiae bacterium]
MTALILIYGAILCVFAVTLRIVATQKVALIIGTLSAGLLSVAIGVAALFGEKRRRWIVITLVGFVMFIAMQAITVWTAPSEGSGAVTRSLTTMAALLSFGMLLYSLHGERPPEFYRSGLPETPDRDESNERRNQRERR